MSSGIITILALAGFLAIAWWVYIVKSGKDFDEQAHMPLDDEPPRAQIHNSELQDPNLQDSSHGESPQ